MDVEPPAPAKRSALQPRLSEAEALLAGRCGASGAGLIRALFAGQAPEDLAPYGTEALAALGESALNWLDWREPGRPKVRVAPPPLPAAPAIAVVEIVGDDMPFLLDSVLGELREQGLEPRLVAHPVLAVERDHDGRLLAWTDRRHHEPSWRLESFIHIHVDWHVEWDVDRAEDAARRDALVAALSATLADVRLAVEDWWAMRTCVEAVASMLGNAPHTLPDGEVGEAVAFLRWLLADNFTFLGLRAYSLDPSGALVPDEAGGLGILKAPGVEVLRRGNDLVAVTPEVMAFLAEPKALIITKAGVRARVHRRVHMDYIGIKRFDAEGRVVGEVRVLGLLTATAYTRPARGIPYLRRRVETMLARAGFDADSHSGRVLDNVLETWPRDELFQIDEDTLLEFALAVMQLVERPRVRVLPRIDRFDQFVSVLVYVPRDRYDSQVRSAIAAHLASAYRGSIAAVTPYFTEGPLVRIFFMVSRYAGETPRPDRAALEEAVAAIILTWQDHLIQALADTNPPDQAHALTVKWVEAFPPAYRAAFSPLATVADIATLERLGAERPFGVTFYRHADDPAASARLRLWSHARPVPLSERVPVLEHMGFRVLEESTFQLAPPAGGAAAWLHDMVLERSGGGALDLEALRHRLEVSFLKAMSGAVENDGYNALTLAAGLSWRDIVLVRMLSRYLRQIGVRYSQDYMWTTLARHPQLATSIVELFHARFSPTDDAHDSAAAREATLAARIEAALADVDSLDEDRIIRAFVNLVQAGLRTSFYQLEPDGQPKAVIALKLDSRKIEGLPLPRPHVEVFVYAPQLEAVHLRFGKVARGGIRWSDRRQDFRTEILGLVKAQQVKNAVIVPVGAKGGFVPKRLPGGPREAIQAEGVRAYRAFMGALLDVTDTLAPDGTVVPADLKRHDGDDPYLVVAADKGTATFSDIANAIAQERGFWLDDAFASGGSAGYDHKAMGITARGAWESVKRHFREMNVDISRTPFTVAGVGDMSGDVFGNGMLLERTIRLVAAFDHRDIFIDPDPDPEASLAERRRLFSLPRSSWQDFDRAVISPGGGVYPRSAKEIVLAANARAVLGLERERVTPAELISAILKAPVDLLWFGGIGTYVRAAEETNEAVGDRANDGVRVTADELSCKVVGEGANLGMTQRSRIAAARAGVRLNTDAIDNSAGVNTSDVEVNLKIALRGPLRDGRLDRAGRDALLSSMTADVAALVLRNNYQQTQALSLAERRGLEDFGFQQRLMQTLERRGLLDRSVETLPDDVELAERRANGEALTRPELAVLLAYAKLSLGHDLVDSAVPDDPYFARELTRYFPAAMATRFPDALDQHRLRREIIATQLVNSLINRGGPTLVVRLADQTGASADRIAAAFVAVRDAFDLISLNTAIEALDNVIPSELQLDLLQSVQNLLLDRMVWMLRHANLAGGLDAVVTRHRAGIDRVAAALAASLAPEANAARAARAGKLEAAGVPQALARRLADLPWLAGATDIVCVAGRSGRAVEDVAATWFAAALYFQLDRLVASARSLAVADHFDRLALDRALDRIGDSVRRITAEMLREGTQGEPALRAWMATRGDAVERVRRAVQEIASSGLTVSKLTVAASFLGDLAPG